MEKAAQKPTCLLYLARKIYPFDTSSPPPLRSGHRRREALTREGTEVADVTPQIFGFKRDGRGEEETFEAGEGRREGCIFYGRPPPPFGRVGRRSPLREKVEKRGGGRISSLFFFGRRGRGA